MRLGTDVAVLDDRRQNMASRTRSRNRETGLEPVESRKA
jgi:hypothetical protein